VEKGRKDVETGGRIVVSGPPCCMRRRLEKYVVTGCPGVATRCSSLIVKTVCILTARAYGTIRPKALGGQEKRGHAMARVRCEVEEGS